MTNVAMLAFLYDTGVASLKEIADATGQTVASAASYFGSYHDYGLVTKYGNEPDSLVRWDSRYVEPWMMDYIREGRKELTDAAPAVKA